MNRHPSFKYFVIKFWKLPFKGIDELVCIPSSWILRRATNKKVLVAYPVEHSKHTERRVKQRQRLSEAWRGYVADIKYGTDSYVDAQNFIKEQKEYKCPNAEKNRGPELSAKKKAQKSKREYKSNQKTAIPEEFVVLKNDESATKIRLKRLELSKARRSVKTKSNIDTLGSIESTESDSEVEFSSNEASEPSSKNHLSSLYEEFMMENFNNDHCVEEITNFERNTNKTPCGIRNSSNLANQSLDPITINKKEFLTGFFKFVRENPEKTKEVLKLRPPNNNIPTASTSKGTTAEMTKLSGSTRNVEKELIIDVDSDDEDTSKDSSAEGVNISGNTRNVEKEQYNDNGDEEGQFLNKNRGHEQKFILPPEYDENNSRWTLKYHKPTPELVELIPHTGVYVNAVKLSNCMRLAKDCNSLAKNLMAEIFKESALSTCSLTGKKARGYDIFGVRPGLNEKARMVLIAFVKEYGRKKGWQTNTQTILNNIRNKLRDMRRKQK